MVDVRKAPARLVGDMKVGGPRQSPKVVGVSCTRGCAGAQLMEADRVLRGWWRLSDDFMMDR